MLKIFLTALCATVTSLSFGANLMTNKEVFKKNRDTLVQIYVNNRFSGTGFLISSDGIVATANHVVSLKENQFKKFADNIKVFVPLTGAVLDAAPLTTITDESVAQDTALLKVNGSNFTFVELGNLSDAEEGDSITVIGSIPGLGKQVLFTGLVSGKGSTNGPSPVNLVLFQSPVRGGFSGSPLFDSKGRVIGIVSTKVFGISPALDTMRAQLESGSAAGSSVRLYGTVDIGKSLIELTNVLDQNLVSGMGTAVSIEYAVKMLRDVGSPKK